MAVKALFLDRDGVINQDVGYVSRAEHFHFIDGIFDLCRAAIDNKYMIIIVTNQSGIERGYFTEQEFQSLTQWMLNCFETAGIHITDVFHCPTLSGSNRKPNPGMFLTAKERYNIDMQNSISLGDKERDILAGRRAGVGTNVLFSTSCSSSDAGQVITTLNEMQNLLKDDQCECLLNTNIAKNPRLGQSSES